jgi:hypothetical protein
MAKLEDSHKWGKTPNTDSKAVPIEWAKVKSVMAITISKASLRLAKIKSQTFEVADVENPIRLIKGQLCVDVKCSWYGKRAVSTDTQRLTITNNYKLVKDYTGEVVKNIGRLKDEQQK